MSSEATFADAVGEALAAAMREDDSVLVLGEDVRYGYITDATAGLVDEFGPERVLNTPIAENAILGMGVGTAMRGIPTVVEVMFCDVALLAFDQLMNQATKVPTIFDGQVEVPLVVRMLSGHFAGAMGPQHSKYLAALFAHVPGLKVVAPSTPHQAKGLLATAIADPYPVAFLEHTRLLFEEGPVPADGVAIGYDEALEVVREGDDAAVVASAWMRHEAERAAVALGDEGIDVRVVDVPVIDPLPRERLLEALDGVDRVVIADEGFPRCGVGAELVAVLAEEAMGDLEAVERVNALNTPIPANADHQDAVIPDADDIAGTVRSIA